MNQMMGIVATAAVSMAVGATAAYVATQDHRQIRRTVRQLARGAEKTLIDLDRAVEHYTR